MDVIIAIDASTTGTKAIAFSADGEVRAIGRGSVDRSSPVPTWHEQDPLEWWSSTVDALAAVMATLTSNGDRPVAVGITHQRESFACLNVDFDPLRPAILWVDARAGAQVKSLGSANVHRISGKPPSVTPSMYKIAWLAEHEPETIANTVFLSDVHGYLSKKLTGEFITSSASADPMGLMDITTGEWSETLLSLVGLRREMLPKLVKPGTIVGAITPEAAQATGLPSGIPIVAGGGDGQCAGLGVGVLSSQSAYLSLGSSIVLGSHSENAETSLAYRLLESPLGHGHTIEAYVASGALSVSWFTQTFSSSDADADELLREGLSRSTAGARGLFFLPYLSGASTPYWDEDARGAFIGADDGHTKEDFYRAVIEGLVYEIRLLVEGLHTAGAHVEEVRATGGGAASDRWLQIISDVLGLPVHSSTNSEATALGAAILAASAVNFAGSSLSAVTAKMSRIDRTFSPHAESVAVYEPLYRIYRELYPALAPVYEKHRALTEPIPEQPSIA